MQYALSYKEHSIVNTPLRRFFLRMAPAAAAAITMTMIAVNAQMSQELAEVSNAGGDEWPIPIGLQYIDWPPVTSSSAPVLVIQITRINHFMIDKRYSFRDDLHSFSG
jgi:hypothetical protein